LASNVKQYQSSFYCWTQRSWEQSKHSVQDGACRRKRAISL